MMRFTPWPSPPPFGETKSPDPDSSKGVMESDLPPNFSANTHIKTQDDKFQSIPPSLHGQVMEPYSPAHPASIFLEKTHFERTSDTTGQMAPPGLRPKVTAILWEGLRTLCFQVEYDSICVARRVDNDMINGTMLLNVARVTRGRRDGLLKCEKVKDVVKKGPMHLRGVWIPYERALDFANQERITEQLYPLFIHDISFTLYSCWGIENSASYGTIFKAKNATKGVKLGDVEALKPIEAPIKFKDAIGRNFSFSWQLCKTWKGMKALIEQACLHIDVVGQDVRKGHYYLAGPEGDVIMPEVWESVVQPGWTVTMQIRRPISQLPQSSPKTTNSALLESGNLNWLSYLDDAVDKDEDNSMYESLNSPSDWDLRSEKSNDERHEARSTSANIEQSEERGSVNHDHTRLCLSSAIMRYVAAVTQRLDFQSIENSRRCENNKGSKDTSVAGDKLSETATNKASLIQRGKRNARDSEEASNDDDDRENDPRRRGIKKRKLSDTRSPNLFACFFHKREPWKFRKTPAEDYYKTCPGGYPTVHRLWSDHCRRLHKARIHCRRCKDLFNTQEELEVHLYQSDPACKVNNEKAVEGISEGHRRACGEKVKKCKSEKEKWECIYQVLFPGEVVPSPYVEPHNTMSPLAQEMTQFAESYQENELPRLLEVLHSAESSITRSTLGSTVTHIFQNFVEKFGVKFFDRLPESQTVLSTAQSSHIQDEGSSIGSNAEPDGDSRNITSELTPSDHMRESQGSDLEQPTASPGEPVTPVSQEQEHTVSPACNLERIDAFAQISNPEPDSDIATLQYAMPGCEYLDVPDPVIHLDEYIESLLAHTSSWPHDGLHFGPLQDSQGRADQIHKSYQQCNLIQRPTDERNFEDGSHGQAEHNRK